MREQRPLWIYLLALVLALPSIPATVHHPLATPPARVGGTVGAAAPHVAAVVGGSGTNASRPAGWYEWKIVNPPARELEGMGYDPSDGYVVMFGGDALNPVNGTPTALGDTWAYRNGDWYELCSGSKAAPSCAASPPAGPASMAYDPDVAGMVLLAEDGSFWAFHAGGWRSLNLTGGPGACVYLAPPDYPQCGQPIQPMVYDSASGAVVIDSGASEWDLVNGTVTAVPTTSLNGRCTPAVLFYDPLSVSLEGLCYDSFSGTQLWRLEGSNWTQVPSKSAPARSYPEGVDFDPILGAAVVQFGDEYAGSKVPAYSWLLRNGTWTNVSDSLPSIPPAGFGYGEMVWDAVDHSSLLLDGVYPGVFAYVNSVFNFTWSLWDDLTVAETPSPASIELGQNLSLQYSVSGGLGALAVNITGVPTGCAAPLEGVAEVCRPSVVGVYPFQVVVNDTATNVSASAGENLSVYPDLEANVSQAEVAATVGEPVAFAAAISGGDPPYAPVWDWGDGSSSDTPTASHSWPTTGEHQVTFSVRDQLGDARTAELSVTVNPALSAVLTANVSHTDIGLPVAFTPAIYGGTAPFQTTWGFSPAAAYGAGPDAFAFSTGGLQQIVAHITDASGASVTANTTVAVAWDPTVSLTANATVLPAGTPIRFAVAVQYGTAPFDVEWSFGDGQSGSTSSFGAIVSFSHAYAPAANFTVLVNVTDALGERAESSLAITGLPVPENSTVLRPANPPPPATGSTAGDLTLLIAAAAVGAVGVIALYRWRRQRTPRR